MTTDVERVDLLPAPSASTDWRMMLWLGFGIIAFTFGGLGGWSAVARLDSAIVVAQMAQLIRVEPEPTGQYVLVVCPE